MLQLKKDEWDEESVDNLIKDALKHLTTVSLRMVEAKIFNFIDNPSRENLNEVIQLKRETESMVHDYYSRYGKEAK